MIHDIYIYIHIICIYIYLICIYIYIYIWAWYVQLVSLSPSGVESNLAWTLEELKMLGPGWVGRLFESQAGESPEKGTGNGKVTFKVISW